MMLSTEGKQYTAGELRELLGTCGFVEVSVTPTYGYCSLTMGREPDPAAPAR